MGIPSYFSYIIKNHSNIIRGSKRSRNIQLMQFSSLFMDCNSIIYDSVRIVETVQSPENVEDRIINAVISKIHYYVNQINPSNVLYIAFDGVAPYAKMEQQRIRRHKTGYLSSIDFEQSANKPPFAKWNTSAITPGTDFMNKLSARIKDNFTKHPNFFGVKKIIVSASDEAGEGEHKMFQYIRNHALPTEQIAVYGLDADLIMLSLLHRFYCENIYIFRESPAFGKSLLNNKYDDDELIFLDNKALSKAILREMGINGDANDAKGRIQDYIFMSFFLGNDFLPHFPALNIRTHGIFTLLETYKRIIGTSVEKRFICIETGNIKWKCVKMFLAELVKQEHKMILEEYNSRHKMENRVYPTTTKYEREIAFDNIPTIYRSDEHYINPTEQGWQSRYYRVAFHVEVKEATREQTTSFIDAVCKNYMEGLEWVFKYYTDGCIHWRWKYHYHYPPLLQDLVKYMSDVDNISYINTHVGINKPFHPNTQLAYVIPSWNHYLLPDTAIKLIADIGINKYYTTLEGMHFKWMFCKYFWESHAILNEIPLSLLELFDSAIVKNMRK